MTETPKEIREKLVIDWYEKKLNRDELLRVLEGSKSLDENVKKKIEKEILENFYENFDKAKGDENFQSADAEYRAIKKNKRQLKKASENLSQKVKETKNELERIDESMFKIAETVQKIDEKSRGKAHKLKDIKVQWDELKKQQRKIQREISELSREKEQLNKSLKEREGNYGTSDRVIDNDNKSAYKKDVTKHKNLVKRESLLEKEETYTSYKEKYFQLIKDKEKYLKNLISKIENADLGIDEEKKKEILELLKSCIYKEINAAKLGDDVIKQGDEIRKWLAENWKPTMEKLSELRKKMTKKEIEIIGKKQDEIKAKLLGASIDEIFEINKAQYALQTELAKLTGEYNPIVSDIVGKLKDYNGEILDLSKGIVVETWEERENRIKEIENKKKEIENKKKERAELIGRYRYELDELQRNARSFVGNHLGCPNGRQEKLDVFTEEDRMVVESNGKTGLVELFECCINGYYSKKSRRLFVKVGNYVSDRDFVYDYYSDRDDRSKAYTKIIDAKIEGDTLKVRLGKDEDEKGTMYEFKIDETKNIFINK